MVVILTLLHINRYFASLGITVCMGQIDNLTSMDCYTVIVGSYIENTRRVSFDGKG